MNIRTIITQPEGRRLEFKEMIPTRSELSKTIVAFANDAGGDISESEIIPVKLQVF